MWQKHECRLRSQCVRYTMSDIRTAATAASCFVLGWAKCKPLLLQLMTAPEGILSSAFLRCLSWVATKKWLLLSDPVYAREEAGVLVLSVFWDGVCVYVTICCSSVL